MKCLIKDLKKMEPYKPIFKVYALLLVFSILIILILYLLKLNENNEVYSFIAGIIASTMVAMCIDIATCKRENRKFRHKQYFLFSEYGEKMSFLRLFVARRANQYADNNNDHTFGEWLFIINNIKKCYGDDLASEISENYRQIVRIIEDIKEYLLFLQRSRPILIESAMVNDSTFRKHLTNQIDSCNYIIDDYKHKNFEGLNEYLRLLVNNYHSYFEKEDQFPQKYNGLQKENSFFKTPQF